MFFTPIFIVFTLFLLAKAQTTTKYVTTKHVTTIYKTSTHTHTSIQRLKPTPVLPTSMLLEETPRAVQEYLNHITIQPEFTSALEAVQSAIPYEVYYDYVGRDSNPFGSWPAHGYPPSWLSEVPVSDVSYISSFMDMENSIKTSLMMRPTAGSAPTNRPRVEVVGAALAVGAAGLAML